MNTWFKVKVKYTKQLESGSFKRVSEPYLLSAMTFTDAEARIYEELGTFIRGEFSVMGITREDIQDIFQYDDADTWFKCKISYDNIDDEGDKKRTVTQNFLVSAKTVKDSYERIEESLETLMLDYQIISIIASPIVEIFPYKEEEVALPGKKSKMDDEENPPKSIGEIFSAPGTDFDDLKEALEINKEDESEISDEFSDKEE
ncbi:MAG: hypothetical protein RL528_689 [Bacteroidota bacterium]|jgi:hypothetical protein